MRVNYQLYSPDVLNERKIIPTLLECTRKENPVYCCSNYSCGAKLCWTKQLRYVHINSNTFHTYCCWNILYNSYGNGLTTEETGFNSRQEQDFFSSPKSLHGLWGSPTGSFPHWYSGRGVRLYIHLHLVPSVRMHGAVLHPPTNMPYGVIIKHRDNSTF